MLHTITASKCFLIFYPLCDGIVLGGVAAGIAYAGQREVVYPFIVWMWGLVIGGTAYAFNSLWAKAIYARERNHEMDVDDKRTEATYRPPAPDGFQAVPMYANSTPLAYQPGMVFIQGEDGYTRTLHISQQELTILQRRIGQNELSLPVNGVSGISSTRMKVIRPEAVGQDLARDKGGSRIEWTPEGAAGILTASPAPIVRRGAR